MGIGAFGNTTDSVDDISSASEDLSGGKCVGDDDRDRGNPGGLPRSGGVGVHSNCPAVSGGAASCDAPRSPSVPTAIEKVTCDDEPISDICCFTGNRPSASGWISGANGRGRFSDADDSAVDGAANLTTFFATASDEVLLPSID